MYTSFRGNACSSMTLPPKGPKPYPPNFPPPKNNKIRNKQTQVVCPSYMSDRKKNAFI